MVGHQILLTNSPVNVSQLEGRINSQILGVKRVKKWKEIGMDNMHTDVRIQRVNNTHPNIWPLLRIIAFVIL